MSIAELDDIKSFVRTALSGVEDDINTNSLNAAIELINTDCNRQFVVAGTATARIYTPNPSSSILRIHDCATITSVVENGTTLTAGVGYQAEPLNNLDGSGDYRPYDQLRRASGFSWYESSTGFASVTVTAAWGWTVIPARVVEAVKILTKDIIDHRDVKFGLAGVTDFGGVRTRQAAIISDLQRRLRREEALIA
jgi:hypothetical protein